jgi:4-aminobutyrate aminotransferase
VETCPSYDELVARLDDLLAPCLAQDWPNLPVERAEGVYLYTRDGRRVLDFLAGFGACNVGHNHPRVVAAAREQMERMVHAPLGVIAHEPALRLAWELGQITPGGADMFFFGNSGAEAVWREPSNWPATPPGGAASLPFWADFTGGPWGPSRSPPPRCATAPATVRFSPMCTTPASRTPFRSSAPDPDACAREALEDIERLLEYVIAPQDVAAFLLEPIQGEGGYVIPPRPWLVALRQLADEHGILLIFDEVQTGFGRTGEWFAAQAFGVEPDILCLAKGIANGFPLGGGWRPVGT